MLGGSSGYHLQQFCRREKILKLYTTIYKEKEEREKSLILVLIKNANNKFGILNS